MFKVLHGTTSTNKEPLLVYKGPFTQNLFLHQKNKKGGREGGSWAVSEKIQKIQKRNSAWQKSVFKLAMLSCCFNDDVVKSDT